MNSGSFPTLRVGKRLLVSTDRFLEWIESHSDNIKVEIWWRYDGGCKNRKVTKMSLAKVFRWWRCRNENLHRHLICCQILSLLPAFSGLVTSIFLKLQECDVNFSLSPNGRNPVITGTDRYCEWAAHWKCRHSFILLLFCFFSEALLERVFEHNNTHSRARTRTHARSM